MNKLYIIYLANDVYELPCSVHSNTRSVAEWLSVTRRAVQLHLAGHTQSIGRGYKVELILGG